jgi:hypothetical protein
MIKKKKSRILFKCLIAFSSLLLLSGPISSASVISQQPVFANQTNSLNLRSHSREKICLKFSVSVFRYPLGPRTGAHACMSDQEWSAGYEARKKLGH